MILYINTQDQKRVTVSLKDKDRIARSFTEENEYGSQVLLSLIMELLESENCKMEDLVKIEVETGPGSFTGVRVGISVANALGFSLGIPVNNKKIETEIKY